MGKTLDSWTVAWFSACLAFAAHILDEAMHGTFGFYSDLEAMVTNILPSMHMAPFNFEVWLINLTGTMLVLFALTPLVRARNPLMVPASYLFAAFLTANASLHIVMAITRERFVTGSLTAPLVIAAGLFLFIATARHRLSALPKQG